MTHITHAMWIDTLTTVSFLMLIMGLGFLYYGLTRGLQFFNKAKLTLNIKKDLNLTNDSR